MPDKRSEGIEDRERALRMLAIQLVGQLPADQREANYTLELARELLNGFLHRKSEDARQPLRCVT
ncbi:hypothetical protein CIW48_26970 [Methylobacterium sp. P1-11]|uniref:hypothetical protein n=1 Tax=Methylobacterium sp. P1-11 TaxID=2024616 RepID=UPI0011ED04D2|nr:hypothetical protein [Methylobacterium sp. P1-11]KAA0117849.1 hypothetical protein CIW48_26970 [Methylobacterium sp. P1-11]